MISLSSSSCPEAMPPSFYALPSQRMQTDASVVRQDVERVLDLYVRLEYFSIGSTAGRMVIDESRVGRPRKRKEPERAPRSVEERDQQRNDALRRAVTAPPEAPKFTNEDGSKMRRVAPLASVAQIVRSKSHSHSASPAITDRRMQTWKSTIATKLGRIARACVFCPMEEESVKAIKGLVLGGNTDIRCIHAAALLKAAKLRIDLEHARNVAAQAERNLGSRTKRKRIGDQGVRTAETRRNEARERSTEISGRRIKITRSTVYEEALSLFVLACSEDEATRAYCFREVV